MGAHHRGNLPDDEPCGVHHSQYMTCNAMLYPYLCKMLVSVYDGMTVRISR